MQDLLIQLLRLRLWRRPELPLKHRDALLVLAERGTTSSEVGVQPHQRAVHGFLQGVERQQAQRRPDCSGRRACAPLACQ